MAYIEGQVRNAKPDEKVLLYARSGIWWIQPFANQPFTQIQPDSAWRNSTHLGTEYAAILVDSNFQPSAKLAALPSLGNGILALTTAVGQAAAPFVSKTIRFSGYDWKVRSADSDRGGQTDPYDPANAWTDEKGYLHLRMGEHDGLWSCAEVSLTRSLGNGSYIFVVRDSSHLGPSAVLGLYTNDDLRTDDVRSELDVELSRWGNLTGKNAQFVVQPFYVPDNIYRFEAPAGVLTYAFRWEPGRVEFKTLRGATTNLAGPAISQHVFTSGIPTPASEKAHIVLYEYHHSKSASRQPTEVVIEKFAYLP
ncbi:hypothetical protein DYQ86_04345 [Acidobacteria bacterium AB60]|nr:hypothetical protein DYQ86_04345 [Acidobacteria bacterium AB60]